MIQIQGLGSNYYTAEIGSGDNFFVAYGVPAIPASGGTSGGFYSAAGFTSTPVAASLASGTTLMSFRMSTSSSRKAYINRIRINFGITNLVATPSVSGALAIQRFSGATPTGGTARTPNRMNAISGNTSDVTDIRDSDTALTTTSVAFGTIAGSSLVPQAIGTGNTQMDWIFEPAVPLILNPGDGVCFRTQTAMPAVQTWAYSYSIYWFEE